MPEGNNLNSKGLTPHARHVIAIVAALNLMGMLGEVTVAWMIGSASLFADAADFLEDVLINTLVLVAIGWRVESRKKASCVLAGLILLPAIAALVTAVMKLLQSSPPEPFMLSITAVIALVINLVCALLLIRLRNAKAALMRGAWLAARNDMFANLLILAAGLLMIWWVSPIPDAAVGIIMAIINMKAAAEVFEQARAENPELED